MYMELPQKCPYCDAMMIKDAWDLFISLDQGKVQWNVFYPAWVCSEFCGFYIDMKNESEGFKHEE
jgi:hypothetical protein